MKKVLSQKKSKRYNKETNEEKEYDIKENDNRFFMNSVTNEIIKGDIDNEQTMYQYDEEDLDRLKFQMINDNTILTEGDKIFFKMWNNYIDENHLKPEFNNNLFLLVKQFVEDNIEDIKKKELIMCLYFHLSNLYFYNKVMKEDVISIIMSLDLD